MRVRAAVWGCTCGRRSGCAEQRGTGCSGFLAGVGKGRWQGGLKSSFLPAVRRDLHGEVDFRIMSCTAQQSQAVSLKPVTKQLWCSLYLACFCQIASGNWEMCFWKLKCSIVVGLGLFFVFVSFCFFVLIYVFLFSPLLSSSSIALARGGDHRVELYKVRGCLCCPNTAFTHQVCTEMRRLLRQPSASPWGSQCP